MIEWLPMVNALVVNVVQGTLPVLCYADGMTVYLTKRRIRIFDFTQFAKPRPGEDQRALCIRTVAPKFSRTDVRRQYLSAARKALH